jgi:hypothetical protein
MDRNFNHDDEKVSRNTHPIKHQDEPTSMAVGTDFIDGVSL